MKFIVTKDNIISIEVDVIVNAANTSLLGGGGVDGAIHRAAGKELANACRLLNGCRAGEAKITKGFNLSNCKYIIHTVGSVWIDGKNNEEKILQNCYRESLLLADSYSLKSIAFPCISTGRFGFPKELAAKIAIETIQEESKNCQHIQTVVFSCFDQTDLSIYSEYIF